MSAVPIRTQVGIIGAGPAGLVLSHLLAAAGIESVVLEHRSREYVEQRVRAGVLEHPSVELLRELGLAERLDREGMRHGGIQIAYDGHRHRIDFLELTGKCITVYGQQEVVKDLIAARLDAGAPILFEVADVSIARLRHRRARVIRFTRPTALGGAACATSSPAATASTVCAVRPMPDGLSQSSSATIRSRGSDPGEGGADHGGTRLRRHDRGFALYSMRSPEVTRLYLQVLRTRTSTRGPTTGSGANWLARLPTGDGFQLFDGPIIERPSRRCGASWRRPCGSVAWCSPETPPTSCRPTGAKGMNLAIADVCGAGRRPSTHLERTGDASRWSDYSATACERVSGGSSTSRGG